MTMTRFKSAFLNLVHERRAVHQCTDLDGLDQLCASGVVTGYIGFDCTAPSLHVGSLMQIMTLRRLQQAGHRPIVVLGGGTTKVGDPSFKDESRPLLTDELIAQNTAGIRRVFERFLKFGNGPSDAIMVDNSEWLDDLKYVPFLREVGRHMSVNRMISMDSVKLRLEREQNLTFLEFNYMVMQAYDFVELNRRYGCRLQMGGSDQWGNITAGSDLAGRMGLAQLYGLTTPLIATSSGQKMGKTVSGAVWLNADMRSPYDYWQFWRNTEDGDVGRFLRIFTEMPEAEIARLENLQGAELNEAKKVLATAATAMAHGSEEAERAAATARETFEGGGTARDLPSIIVPREKLAAGLPVFAALVQAGLAASSSEARRAIAGQGIRVNDVVVVDEKAVISLADIGAEDAIKLSYGKKKHVLVKAG